MRREMAVECRWPHREMHSADIAVIGGGMAGTCCAITAARAGADVVLVQDRPILGGNAGSEVRLWILGATAHMGNNNRWAREGGLIDEILVENLWRNREGNPVMLDALLLEKADAEPNLRVLLNTAVFEVDRKRHGPIQRVRAFCSQTGALHEVSAKLFVDASGDGVVAFLAGAGYRMGAEDPSEYGERFAPDQAYGELLGHTIYYYARHTGAPVAYVPPEWALRDITAIPRHRDITPDKKGCSLWWFEYGGRRDTVLDTEKIKWELWRVAYGAWDYVKNSGKYPEAADMTLEWVGLISGKRESRRFDGLATLTQADIIEQRDPFDAVAFGGWSIDLHPADGIYSDRQPCDQWHSRGVYTIPLRSYISRDVPNLFFAGRNIGVSHVAFGSTRVMATCAHGGQAVGMAAARCAARGIRPGKLLEAEQLRGLQTDLLRSGQHIPSLKLRDEANLALRARVGASSRLALRELPADGPEQPLDVPRAQMLPLRPGGVPSVTVRLSADAPATLKCELRTSSRPGGFTPDKLLAGCVVEIPAGPERPVELRFDADVEEPCYAFVCLPAAPGVRVRCSNLRVTGLLSVARRGRQEPQRDIGVESFDFWRPDRRPAGHNWAIALGAALEGWGPEMVLNGTARPTTQPNGWVADPADHEPWLRLDWARPVRAREVVLEFDTDFDHPMESVQWGHPERVPPFCVRRYTLADAQGEVIAAVTDHHQTRRVHRVGGVRELTGLRLTIHETWGAPAAVMGVGVYG